MGRGPRPKKVLNLCIRAYALGLQSVYLMPTSLPLSAEKNLRLSPSYISSLTYPAFLDLYTEHVFVFKSLLKMRLIR